MDRDKVYAIRNNASFPWRTNDHALGLRSLINLKGYSKYEPTYHENFVTDGSSYRFHSPYEFPYHKTSEHISQLKAETQFIITPQISYLGESLMEDNIER